MFYAPSPDLPAYPTQQLRQRTKRFAFDVIGVVRELPRGVVLDVLGRQLVRAAMGVASNHRAAGRARSRCEFVTKLGVILGEADESEFWLGALIECNLVARGSIEPLHKEACELRAIFWDAIRTARVPRRANPRHQ
jgi:four helix bundle protein